MTDSWRAVVTPRANPDGDGLDVSSGQQVSVPNNNLLVESQTSDVVVVHHKLPGSLGALPCEYTFCTHARYATEESTARKRFAKPKLTSGPFKKLLGFDQENNRVYFALQKDLRGHLTTHGIR